MRITNAVQNASEKYNLPPSLVLGVIKQESGFKPKAESQCGAQGLMQLMPETAKGLGVKDSFSIEQNIEGGCKYLRQMLDRFNGNVTHALAAYNAGPGNVEKYNGVPPFAETKNYVKSVVSHAENFQGGKLDMSPVSDEKPVDMIKSAETGAGPQCTVDGEKREQSLVAANQMDRQEIREAVSMIMVTAQKPEIRMPERSKNLLAEEPPPPPPSYAKRV
ncbi:MAG: lytic transglycosylase domain-containing protein [Deltaproteobacteria bacterium]|nr:MAG: lytic transglycosylase domain-containing protein [Deltaproteobacteria bacterium]